MTLDDLKEAFHTAVSEYLDAFHASQKALDEAMHSASTEVRQAYKAAKEEEDRKHSTYLELGRQLRAAINMKRE